MTKKDIMRVANDLGYGATKASMDGEFIKQPSVVALVEQAESDPVNHKNSTDVKNVMDNIFGKMDVVIDKKRYLVGEAAQNSTLDRTIFDTDSGKGKARTDLSRIITLSMIATKAVKEAYDKGEDIFQPLKVSVAMTTALPISEIGINLAGQPNVREEYAQKFLSKNHIVILKNFDYDISVNIEFKAVKVFKEGEIATVVAIKYGSKDVVNALLADLKKYYPDRVDDGLTIIKKSKNTLGIDIGQGTTDLALSTDGAADVYNSASIPLGYGTILKRATQFLPNMVPGLKVKDTIAFSKLLNSNPTNKIDKENKEFALQAEKTSTSNLVNRIVQHVNTILTVSDHLEVIYIFGGGSIPIMERTELRQQLMNSVADHRSSAVVLWVGKDLAQNMNELGLKPMADNMKIED